MAQQIADRRDVDFVLHEQLDVAQFSAHEKFEEYNRKTIDLVVSEARNLSIKEILPTQKIGDQEGCHLENGQVIVPEVFQRLYDIFCEGEWLAMSEDPQWGGQGMPRTVAMACADYFNGANYAFMMYPGLTHGAGKLVEAFGTDEQKKLFLKNMFTGKWTGTMLLTEPGAGSDVGALETSAVKNEDGTYSITGGKIFISSGEHGLVENIIHGAGAHRWGSGRHEGHIAVHRTQDLGQSGRVPGRAQRRGLHRRGREDGHSRQPHLLVDSRREGAVPRPAARGGKQGDARHVPHDERGAPAGGHAGILLCVGLLPQRVGLRPPADPGQEPAADDGQGRSRGAHHPAPGRAAHADDDEDLHQRHAEPALLRGLLRGHEARHRR
jgi:hypothetical protein